MDRKYIISYYNDFIDDWQESFNGFACLEEEVIYYSTIGNIVVPYTKLFDNANIQMLLRHWTDIKFANNNEYNSYPEEYVSALLLYLDTNLKVSL